MRLTCFLLLLALAGSAVAQPQIVAPFNAAYNLRDLGAAPAVPARYGAMAFKPGAPNTLLIGGNGNTPAANIYAVQVTRDASQHITGFSGSSSVYAAGSSSDQGGIDAGLAFGPGGVLFFTSYPDNQLCQIRPGQTTVAKSIYLAQHGITSVGSLVFVPDGFPGAGRLKILDYGAGAWFDVELVSDGNGTYDVGQVSTPIYFEASSPEGAFYVAAGAPNFSQAAVLICDYAADRISAYNLSGLSEPVPSSRRDFITGIIGAEGATRDPLTGDFVFGTFVDPSHVYVVGGFSAPLPPVVTITTPTNNSVFEGPLSVEIVASASQAGGAITRVDFYVDNVLFASDATVPYSVSPHLDLGIHQLSAVAVGSGSSSTPSAVVRISVEAPAYPPLIVMITDPPLGLFVSDCSRTTVRANVLGSSGAVTNVTFYRNGVAVGFGSSAPFSTVITNLGVGPQILTASASDDLGAKGTSVPYYMNVALVATNTVAILPGAGGVYHLCGCGAVGTNYVLETATQLAPNTWLPVSTNLAVEPRLGWTHTNAAPQSFYRTRVAP